MTNVAISSFQPTANADWDIPEHLTNGYIHNSIPRSKSTNPSSFETFSPTDSNGNSSADFTEKRVNFSHYLKQSISVHSGLTNYNNSHRNRMTNPFSNSFSLGRISSILSNSENT